MSNAPKLIPIIVNEGYELLNSVRFKTKIYISANTSSGMKCIINHKDCSNGIKADFEDIEYWNVFTMYFIPEKEYLNEFNFTLRTDIKYGPIFLSPLLKSYSCKKSNLKGAFAGYYTCTEI